MPPLKEVQDGGQQEYDGGVPAAPPCNVVVGIAKELGWEDCLGQSYTLSHHCCKLADWYQACLLKLAEKVVDVMAESVGLVWQHSKCWLACHVDEKAEELLDVAQLQVGLLEVHLPAEPVKEVKGEEGVCMHFLKCLANDNQVIHVGQDPDPTAVKEVDYTSHESCEEPW